MFCGIKKRESLKLNFFSFKNYPYILFFFEMDAECEVLAFGSVILSSSSHGVKSATINYNHEATWLKMLVLREKSLHQQQSRQYSDALINYSSQNSTFLIEQQRAVEFDTSLGHACLQQTCTMRCARVDELFTCPCPAEDPEEEHLLNNSVVHRASGCVYLCERTGAVHLCTQNACQYQEVMRGGTVVCNLTGLDLGSRLVHEREYSSGICFEDSTKKRTWTRYVDADTTALSIKADKFEALRPDNVERRKHQRRAIEHLAESEMSAMQQVRRPTLLPPRRPVFVDGPGGRVALPAPEGNEALLLEEKERIPLLTSSSQICCAPAEEDSVEDLPGCTPPQQKQVMPHLQACVRRMFTSLGTAYSLAQRNTEIDTAVMSSARRIADACRQEIKRGGKQPSALNFNKAFEIYNTNSACCFVGLEQVLALNNWAPWTSGEFRASRLLQLPQRMWRVWDILSRSKAFTRPYLYLQIDSALMYEVIGGFCMDACVYQDAHGVPCVKNMCSALGTHQCAHKRATLKLIQRDDVLCDITNAPGVKERLSLTDSAMLSKRNIILQLYASLFHDGVRLSDVSKFCVKLTA